MKDPENIILETWQTNAAAWTHAIQQQTIESRRLVTNQAIIDAIIKGNPKNALDIGCGEGWLCRALQSNNIDTTGVDAVPQLIAAAKDQGTGHYQVCSYQQIIEDKFVASKQFDVIVFNFSLFGNELVEDLLSAIKKFLTNDGRLIIQTLHPFSAKGEEPYKDGWRQGNWNGFSKDFKDPAPWYYRTMQSWLSLFIKLGFQLPELQEPVHPVSGLPVSAIFICNKK